MHSVGRLSDQDLLDREFTTFDPANIEGLSLARPAKDQPLIFLMEFHLEQDEAPVRCCVCERRAEHWNGFVVQVGESKHLIGSRCGPKYFGLEFRKGGNALKVAVGRKRELRRALDLKARSDLLLAYMPSHDALASILAVQNQLKAHTPILYRELRDLANRGEPFSVTEQVRDFERERRTNAGGPLYRHDRRPLGPIRGVGLLRADTLARSFESRRRSLAVLLNAIAADTDSVADRALSKLVRSVEAENAKAADAVETLNRAADFFSPDNLQRMSAWMATVRVEPLLIDKGRIGVRPPGGRRIWIGPLEAELAPPPPLFVG